MSCSSLHLLEMQRELVPATIPEASKNYIKSRQTTRVAGLEILTAFENLKNLLGKDHQDIVHFVKPVI